MHTGFRSFDAKLPIGDPIKGFSTGRSLGNLPWNPVVVSVEVMELLVITHYALFYTHSHHERGNLPFGVWLLQNVVPLVLTEKLFLIYFIVSTESYKLNKLTRVKTLGTPFSAVAPLPQPWSCAGVLRPSAFVFCGSARNTC